jgi:hypothetical protein
MIVHLSLEAQLYGIECFGRVMTYLTVLFLR